MALKYDSSKAEGAFTLLPEGEYEAFISAVDHKYSSNGNEMLVVNYKIRDDVEQEGKGQEIRFDNYVNTEKALWKFHALNKALEADEGAEWNDFKEWMPFIKGKAVRLVVKHEEADFGKNAGKTFAVAGGYKKSTVGGQMEIKTPGDDPLNGYQSGQIDISDDDLPF